MIDDEELMSRVAAGEQEALSELYDRYAGTVVGVANRIVGDRGVAEEVMQEVFWRVWKNASSFDRSRAKFTTWLFSITRRYAIDVYRKQKVRPHALAGQDAVELLQTVASDANVAAAATLQIQRRRVHDVLTQLPPDQRQVVEMAYFEGKTRREIAEQTEIPLGTVHTRARLALNRLRRALQAREDEEDV